MAQQNGRLTSELAPAAGSTAREGFGSKELSVSAETAGMATAEMVKAMVQARFIVAMQRPRNLDDARVRVLNDCKRLGFAQKATWSKPRGNQTISGPSIRLAEALMRNLGNIHTSSVTIYDDREKRIKRVSATDLESNATVEVDVTIEKTVERQEARGRQVIYERTNTHGKKVFIVIATDDEMLEKEANVVSKALRTALFRLVPADILEEAIETARATVRSGDKSTDPAQARKAVADSFAGIGINPKALVEYLGHPLEQTTPAELADLRELFVALREGETNWAEVMREKKGAETGGAVAPAPGPTPAPTPEPAAQTVVEAMAMDPAEMAAYGLIERIQGAASKKELQSLAAEVKRTADAYRPTVAAEYERKLTQL